MPSFYGAIILGFSVLVATISMVYLNLDALLKHALPSSGNNSIFNSILSSFASGEESPSFALKTDFGLITRNMVAANQSLLTISLDATHMVIDGVHNVPGQFASLLQFSELSLDARTTLSIAVLKSTNDDFPNSFSLLWKAAGVRPLPDSRWVMNKGLFSLPRDSATGVAEIDLEVARAYARIDECLAFIRSNPTRALRGVTEIDLQWSWIFLNAFGVPLSDDRKIIIGPLVFARHSIDTEKTVKISADPSSISVTSPNKMERGDEILIDGSRDVTDGYAWLYHGSWLADESIHRGRFGLAVDPAFTVDSKECEIFSQGELKIWLSNDSAELDHTRDILHHCMRRIIPGGQRSDLSHHARVVAHILHMLKGEVRRVGSVGDNAVKFQYANLLLNEVGYWEAMRTALVSQQVEV